MKPSFARRRRARVSLNIRLSSSSGSVALQTCHPLVPQLRNCVQPSAPVTMTSIQILMASGEGATMQQRRSWVFTQKVREGFGLWRATGNILAFQRRIICKIFIYNLFFLKHRASNKVQTPMRTFRVKRFVRFQFTEFLINVKIPEPNSHFSQKVLRSI